MDEHWGHSSSPAESKIASEKIIVVLEISDVENNVVENDDVPSEKPQKA